MQDTKEQDPLLRVNLGSAAMAKPWWMRRNEKLGGDFWWRKDHKMVSCQLPLAIPDTSENLTNYIGRRLRLIKIYDFLDYKALIKLIEQKQAGRDCTVEVEDLKKSFPLQINDFDHTELVVSALKDKAISDELRLCMIPRVSHLNIYAEQEGFLEHESKYVMEKVSELALPRIRAKLAYKECLFLLQPGWGPFCDLVHLCPNYLKSDWAIKNLHVLRERAAYGNTDDSFKAKTDIEMLQKAILGQTKRQARQYSYFQVHQEFQDMVAAFKKFADEKKDNAQKAKKDLLFFAKIFEISDDSVARVISERSKPTHHALEILIEKKRIESHATYHNKVKPYLKELFKIYPDLEFDWSHVRRFMDLCIRHPDIFAPVEIWTRRSPRKTAPVAS